MIIFVFLTDRQLMRKLYYAMLSAVLMLVSDCAFAQTAKSLFWKSDSLQVAEIVSEKADRYADIGHCGPAVENSHMALCVYFNDSGAIDLYSKSGRGMELQTYLWYPSTEIREMAAAGCDAYVVGETLGFGGYALWDGEKEVRLVATKGRTARVGDTKKGAFAEVISYGVPYKGDVLDISVRIDVSSKSREAIVTATELSGKKIQFLSGLNYHAGQNVAMGEDFISVWGEHPGDEFSIPLGAGLRFSAKDFLMVEKKDDMVRIISKPVSQVKTTLIGASVMEAELNSVKRFQTYIAQ